MSASDATSYVARFAALADLHPDKTAVVTVARNGQEHLLSWSALQRLSTERARQLARHGVGTGSLLVLAIDNGWEHFVFALAAWKNNAAVLPIPMQTPDPERDAILTVAESRWAVLTVVSDTSSIPVGEPIHRYVTLDELASTTVGAAASTVTRDVSDAGLVLCSGGSTGRPKLIVNHGAMIDVPTTGAVAGVPGRLGMRAGQIQLMAAPLHHGAPIAWSLRGLFHDHTVVLMQKFDAAQAVALIARHRVQWAFLVPTMLARMARIEPTDLGTFDSIEAVWSASASCPEWVKRHWIQVLGAERLREAYGGSESAGATVVTGNEWLQRPGTVGRPVPPWQVQVFDDNMEPVSAGTVGHLAFRQAGNPKTPFEYVGSTVKIIADGWISVGDLGWVDGDGYLFIADRRIDMIVSGGANIYPAEVEAVLTEHPDVADAVAIGLPDSDMGQRVHAIVEPRDAGAPPDPSELDGYFQSRIAKYKRPRSYEFTTLPRDEFGKIRRSKLMNDRVEQSPTTQRNENS